MIALNTTYLNRTPNKTPRSAPGFKPEFAVMHETAGYGSLDWNLKPEVRSSYNYLINRTGVIYHYVDERAYIAWHAGISSAARGYTGGQLNIYSIGVELEGMNDGTPITQAQTNSMLQVLKYFRETYGIPITLEYYFAHKDVAPGYKTDPRGYSVEHTIKLIADAEQKPPPDITVIGVPASISHGRYKAALVRNGAPFSEVEVLRTYEVCRWLDIDPAFMVAVWAHEGGRPLGSSPLQQQTRCPINLKAAPNEWRPTVSYDGADWLAFESYQLGFFAGVIHIKNMYGWRHHLHTVRTIIPALAPASDGNDVEAYIKSVLEDMKYMREH